MIARTLIPNGWYVDVDGVWGDYAVLIPDVHIKTALGSLPLPNDPPENLLYLRTWGGKVTGVGGRSDLAWEWDGQGWIAYGLIAGISPCLYDTTGRLLLAPVSAGSQGYRYCDDDTNQPVSGDDTYNSTTPLARQYGLSGLWEWTRHQELIIGQNAADQCVIVGPLGRRVLDTHVCRFIRFVRDGDRCAVGIWQPESRRAVVLTFRVSDIASLPVDAVTPPVDGPPVVLPPSPPPPPPEVPPVATAPPDNGIVDGVVVNPKHYFQSLTWNTDPRGYAGVILSLKDQLWRYGIGFQTRSDGTPTSRLFLPTAICPTAAPPPGDALAMTLGVKQDERCWDQQGRFVNTIENDANGPKAWTWDEHGGPAYQPVSNTTAPPTPPVTPPVTPPATGLEGRVAQLEREGVLDRRTMDGVIEQANQTDDAADKLDTRVSDLEAAEGSGTLPADVVRESTHEGSVALFGQTLKIPLKKKP